MSGTKTTQNLTDFALYVDCALVVLQPPLLPPLLPFASTALGQTAKSRATRGKPTRISNERPCEVCLQTQAVKKKIFFFNF